MSYDLAAINPDNEFLGNLAITLTAGVLMAHHDLVKADAVNMAFELYDAVVTESKSRDKERNKKGK